MKKGIKKQVKQKVAIFDIDGTIFRSSLLIEMTEALIKEKIFPAKTRDIYKTAFKKWTDRQGSYDDYINAVVQAFMKNLVGVNYKVFNKIVKRVIAENSNKVYRYTRDLVEELKRKNYYLLAISHSPQVLVNGFCQKLGFDKTYGRLYEVGLDDRYTGKTLFLDLISDKSKILTRAVEKEGLTLKGSVGVGDSESDIVFLKMVDKPICFNPNKILYTYAKRHGFKVVLERKDMIYEL